MPLELAVRIRAHTTGTEFERAFVFGIFVLPNYRRETGPFNVAAEPNPR